MAVENIADFGIADAMLSMRTCYGCLGLTSGVMVDETV